jgi:hypothetical protein
MAEGNGVTRREFDDLKNDLRDAKREYRSALYALERDLRKEYEDLDRTGTRALGEIILRVTNLEKRGDKQDDNWKWLGRGLIAIIFSVMGAIIILAASGVLGGG